MQITLRPVQPEDELFLYKVYCSTREEELAAVDWDEPAKETFLQMQFNAQQSHYQLHRAFAEYLVVCHAETPIGQLFIDREEDNLHLLDISFLPAYRGQGLGTFFLQKFVEEADAKNQTATLYVHIGNRAIHLYQRFGFQVVKDVGFYHFMRRERSSN